MRKFCARIQYDGSPFYGFQRLKDRPSVQEELEKAFRSLFHQEVLVTGAGRTDKGVHALGQVIHFKLAYSGEPYKLMAGINHYLHEAIQCVACEEVEESFHARFDAKEKIYEYRLYNDYFMPPIYRYYRGHRKYPLSVEKMQEASYYLLGGHDFRSFCQEEAGVDTRRVLDQIQIYRDGHDIVFTFRAQSFMKNMIRIIVGSLVDVGRGKHPPSWIKEVLEREDRELAGMTISPYGLYLMEIRYD